MSDNSDIVTQQADWEAIDAHLKALINSLTPATLVDQIPEFFHVNLVRGAPLFAVNVLNEALSEPKKVPVLASLVAVINSRIPNVGLSIAQHLLVKFRQNDEHRVTATRFLGYLIRNRTVTEILGLQLISDLFSGASDETSLLAVCDLLTVCAGRLDSREIFDQLRRVGNFRTVSAGLAARIQDVHDLRKRGWKGEHVEDLVEEGDIVTHGPDVLDLETAGISDVGFQAVSAEVFEQQNAEWAEMAAEILAVPEEEEDREEGGEALEEFAAEISEVGVRKQVYLVLMSSVSCEEAEGKLRGLPPHLVSRTIAEASAVEKTYNQFHALVAAQLMRGKGRVYTEIFGELFRELYETAHRLETGQLKNSASFYSHLFACETLSWENLAVCRLTEQETNSSSRVFLKFLLLDLAENMGTGKLQTKLEKSPHGLFPSDNSDTLKFAINFFTAIGLGSLTDAPRRKLLAMVAADQIADDAHDMRKRRRLGTDAKSYYY